MTENIDESKVEMVILTVLKPVLDILFCLGSIWSYVLWPNKKNLENNDDYNHLN